MIDYLLYSMSLYIPDDIPDHKYQKICYSCNIYQGIPVYSFLQNIHPGTLKKENKEAIILGNKHYCLLFRSRKQHH